jgi:hypothetical protein
LAGAPHPCARTAPRGMPCAPHRADPVSEAKQWVQQAREDLRQLLLQDKSMRVGVVPLLAAALDGRGAGLPVCVCANLCDICTTCLRVSLCTLA